MRERRRASVDEARGVDEITGRDIKNLSAVGINRFDRPGDRLEKAVSLVLEVRCPGQAID